MTARTQPRQGDANQAAPAAQGSTSAEFGSRTPPDFEAAVDELYGVPPADFLPRRTALVAQARAAKDKALAARIGKLRKPSAAAAQVNALVRARPDLRESIEEVGARLRAAQATMHGTALTALRPDRDRVIQEILAAATDMCRGLGQSLTPAAAAEIRDTVIAAIASAEASAVVTSGRLTRALQYSGFGDVDLADAVVVTRTGTQLRVVPGAGSSADPAPEPAAAAAAAAAAAVRAKSAATAASAVVDTLKVRAAELGAELAAAQRALDDAFARDAEARVAVTAAIATRELAAAELAAAQAQGDIDGD